MFDVDKIYNKYKNKKMFFGVSISPINCLNIHNGKDISEGNIIFTVTYDGELFYENKSNAIVIEDENAEVLTAELFTKNDDELLSDIGLFVDLATVFDPFSFEYSEDTRITLSKLRTQKYFYENFKYKIIFVVSDRQQSRNITDIVKSIVGEEEITNKIFSHM